MRNFYILFLIVLLSGIEVLAQSESFRSKSNPYYWKNKAPNQAYWQQDVHYEIEAVIDDTSEIISGKSFKLTYWNNSPYELNELYFHLYANAFQPGSYYHSLWLENGKKEDFGPYEAQKLGTVCKKIKVNGQEVAVTLDNTVMRLNLLESLKPNSSLEVTMEFDTYFDKGNMRRRMKSYESFGYKHFNGVHWYPIIAVYDQKMGWNTNQHMDKEFYANFGVFDISLTFPQEYVVDATGVLQNEDEVMPADLRKKLDISNFKDKPFNEKPSVITPRELGKTKTWKFHAENVHNFAFTADPTYRIDEVEWNGIKVVALAQEPHAARWQESAEFTKAVIEVYSEDFGMYAWPKIIVADAQDGMEYPMLTLDGGTYPGHQGLLAHEVGHMWFYGMVGSNEQYRASLDEGFTQFMTVWALEKLKKQSGYEAEFSYSDRYFRLYYPYLSSVNEGYDAQLNTHSSDFHGAIGQGGGYGLVYFKTGTMLYNLRYVLGEELFDASMKHYFKKWQFCHPYFDDFREAIIEYTQTDLNWFFDQWLETTKQIDYGIKSIKKGNETGEYEITFRRKGLMHMPIEFEVTQQGGKKQQYYIPNTWFVKQTDAKVLTKWYGWNKIKPEYTAIIRSDAPIESVQIDPSYHLADVDLKDNVWRMPSKVEWVLTDWDDPFPDWTKTTKQLSPYLWYNWYDGLQIGAKFKKTYFLADEYIKGGLWFNTGLLQGRDFGEFSNDFNPISGKFNFKKRILSKLIPFESKSFFTFDARFNAGVVDNRIGIEQTIRRQDEYNPNYTKVSLYHKVLYRPSNTDSIYYIRLNPFDQLTDRFNSSINIEINRHYEKEYVIGDLNASFRTPGINSDFSYSYIQLASVHDIVIGKFNLKTRIMARQGFVAKQGISGGSIDVPYESMLYTYGANIEEMLDDSFTEAAGLFPTDWTNPSQFDGTYSALSNFHAGGGLNLRGFSGFTSINSSLLGNDPYSHFGMSGASVNLELDFGEFFRSNYAPFGGFFAFDFYLFADAGAVTGGGFADSQQLGTFLVDAGIGAAVRLKDRLTIRCDIPAYLNISEPDGDNFAFRYLVGVGRAF